MKISMKKITALMLTAVMLLLALPIGTSASSGFDEGNIVFSFGAISDIHIGSSATDAAAQKFESALRQLKAEAEKNDGNGIDAILTAGDLIDGGAYFGRYNQMQYFKTVYERVYSPVDVPMVFAPGNHDVPWGNTAVSKLNTLNSYLDSNYFLTDQGGVTADGNRHCIIDGFHVLSLTPVSGNPTYTQATKNWLDSTLAAITAEDPDRFVFILNHPMIYDTVYGSDLGPSWYTKDLTSILSKYPQVVIFGGHLHFPLNDPRSIMQTDFTSVGCGSVSYMAIESGSYEDMDGATTMKDKNDISSGNLVQIDRNGNMRIRRMDFANGKVIGEDWIVSYPTADRSHLNAYRKTRSLTNTAPVLSTLEVGLGAVVGSTQEAVLTFAAGADDEFVHHYVVKYGPKGGAMSTYNILSDFYRNADPADMKTEYAKRLGLLTQGRTYEVSVTAYDSWGAVSNTIVTEVMPDGVAQTPEAAEVYVDLDIAGGQLLDKKGNVTVTNYGGTCADAVIYVNNKAITLPTYNVGYSGAYALCTFKSLSSVSDMEVFAQSGFSVEAFYVMGQKSGVQGVVCGTQAGGWGLAETSGQPYYISGSKSGSYNPYVYSGVTADNKNLVHVVGVYDYFAGEQRIYVNGVLKGTETITDGYLCGASSAFNKFCIGCDINSTGVGGDYPCPDMKLVDAKLYKGALTGEQVTAAYTDAVSIANTELSSSITVSDNILVNVYTNLLDAHRGATLRFTMNGKTAVLNGVKQTGNLYCYTASVTPQCMGDTFTVELVSGETILCTKTTSVCNYLLTLQSKTAEELQCTSTQKAALDTLICDLLVYGGAAQTYTGHGIDDLVSEGITGSAFVTIETDDLAIENNGDGGTFKSATVIFDSILKLRVTVVGDTPVECVRHSVGGGTYSVTPTRQSGANEGEFYYEIPLKAMNIDDRYVLSFTGYEGTTLTYSVKTYVRAMQSREDNMGALARALYSYGLSARAYASAVSAK